MEKYEKPEIIGCPLCAEDKIYLLKDAPCETCRHDKVCLYFKNRLSEKDETIRKITDLHFENNQRVVEKKLEKEGE